jgi:hypothetical protein
MYLILILVGVAVLAYYLAKRNFDKKTIEASKSVANKAKDVGGDLGDRAKVVGGGVQERIKGQSGQSQAFITWATGPGKADLPGDFNEWFAGLDADQKKAFGKALAEYVDSLGMSLTTLTSGRLDKQPDFKSVFVETLVIYSNAYRKIAKAKNKQEENAEVTENNAEADQAGEMKPAEKAPSRRSSEPVMEAAPAAS